MLYMYGVFVLVYWGLLVGWWFVPNGTYSGVLCGVLFGVLCVTPNWVPPRVVKPLGVGYLYVVQYRIRRGYHVPI